MIGNTIPAQVAPTMNTFEAPGNPGVYSEVLNDQMGNFWSAASGLPVLSGNYPRKFQVEDSAAANSPTIASGGLATGPVLLQDDPAFVYYGATNLAVFASSFIYNNTGMYTTVEFMTDSNNFDLALLRFNSQIMVFVDGHPALSTPITLDSAGSGIYYNVAFTGTNKQKRITLCGTNFPFGGVRTTAGDSFWAPPIAARIAAVGAGDSYAGGTNATASAFGCMQAAIRMLGYMGIFEYDGGAGWLSTGTDAPLYRLNQGGPNKCAFRSGGINYPLVPTVHIAPCGFNDAGGNMATLQTNVQNYINASVVKPILIGPWTPVGITANLTAVATAMQAAALSRGVKYIEPNVIVNAANSVVLTSNDFVHPTQRGYSLLGSRLAALLADSTAMPPLMPSTGLYL